MIVALGLPLNVAAIILGCIISMLLSAFSALGPKNIYIYIYIYKGVQKIIVLLEMI